MLLIISIFKTVGSNRIVPDTIGVNRTLREHEETCHLLKLPEHPQLTVWPQSDLSGPFLHLWQEMVLTNIYL